jgi:preprotein translocase subunit SecE
MRFSIYKKSQGTNTRLWSALAAGAVVVLGCVRLYQTLATLDISNQKVLIAVQTLIPAAIAVAGGIFVFWISNKTNVADFLISAEGEVKKVSWSTRKELTVSTFVVIFVVISMACMLAATDVVFQLLFSQMGLFR